MDLEKIAARAFLDELGKIAETSLVEGEKTAAVDLLSQIQEEEVLDLLKEAGLLDMLGGVGRGLGALGMGAVRGAGGLVAGTARGIGGGIAGTARGIGQGISSAYGRLKAAPGALGARMTALGQRAEQGLSNMGARLQQGGQARGATIQARLGGPGQLELPFNRPAKPAAKPVQPTQLSLPLGNAPQGHLAAPTPAITTATPSTLSYQGSPYASLGRPGAAAAPTQVPVRTNAQEQLPMLGMRGTLEQYNPMAGMSGNLADSAVAVGRHIANAARSVRGSVSRAARGGVDEQGIPMQSVFA